MNAFLPAIAAAPPPAEALPVSTAVLILLTGAVAYCLYALAEVRRQVRRLERAAERATSLPGPAPVAGTTSAPVAAAMPAATSPVAPSPGPARERMSPQVLAVIAAAVHATLGGRHRVLSIAPAAQPASSWSVEGRREIFTSHHVR